MKLITHTRTVQEVDNVATGRSARSARQRLGISLREVARRMDLSAPFIGDLELGRRNWTEQLAGLYTKALNSK